jgi:hypothetical protein
MSIFAVFLGVVQVVWAIYLLLTPGDIGSDMAIALVAAGTFTVALGAVAMSISDFADQMAEVLRRKPKKEPSRFVADYRLGGAPSAPTRKPRLSV